MSPREIMVKIMFMVVAHAISAPPMMKNVKGPCPMKLLATTMSVPCSLRVSQGTDPTVTRCSNRYITTTIIMLESRADLYRFEPSMTSPPTSMTKRPQAQNVKSIPDAAKNFPIPLGKRGEKLTARTCEMPVPKNIISAPINIRNKNICSIVVNFMPSRFTM